jgi:HSP20 family molecular chaperone IbpA
VREFPRIREMGIKTLEDVSMGTASRPLYRRFILPDTADAENVNATSRHGVLEISIKKHAKAQPRRIAVK